MIASLKNKNEGIKVLTLSYTGTTQEAQVARQKGKDMEGNQPEGPSESTIRDWTGSGEEHKPGSDGGQVLNLCNDPVLALTLSLRICFRRLDI